MILLIIFMLLLDNSFLGIEIEKSDCKRVESNSKGTFETFVDQDPNSMCKGKLRLKKDGQIYCLQITDSLDDSFKCTVTSSSSTNNEPDGKNGKVNVWLDTVNCLADWEKNLRLGDAYLSTSAKSECARAKFTIGLLTLHNFQYELSIEMFEKAEAAEMSESGRSFPMAMWGAAMATTQILWQNSECEKGKEYLQKIPKGVDWTTEKENAYIQTGFALYPSDIKCAEDNQFARERRFMNAMKNVSNLFPEESEAALFHAVASAAVAAQTPCIGKNCPKTKKENQKKKAINELSALEKELPTHSGLIHYTIHVFDSPELYIEGNRQFLRQRIMPTEQTNHKASMGIRAANKYTQVAKSSCHALHMPSHIYMRIGNWKKSLESNLLSIEACDALTKQRGYGEEELYDSGNLYHSIEYAQYDYLQHGQYAEAKKMLSRVDSVILKLGGADKWEEEGKMKELIWIQQRMNARQQIEPLGIGHKPNSSEWSSWISSLNGRNGTLVSERVSDGWMNYASISELGMLMVHLLHCIKICAKDQTNSCLKNTRVNWVLRQSEELNKNLASRKSLFEYTQHMAHMLHQVMLGIRDLAEAVRPHGVKCFAEKNCRGNEKVLIRKIMTGPFQRATKIQKKLMIQSSATPTLLYMPSYEVFGFVLLAIKRYNEAKQMFESSLEERMGRTQSLLGLARAHSVLGNTKQATYFYKYLRTQLQQADKDMFLGLDNLAVKEAESWLNTQKSKNEELNWFWPNYMPF